MTYIYIEDNSITVRGHADYDEFGHDICCAGISSLTWALKLWIDNNSHMATNYRSECEDGEANFMFEPLPEYESIWVAIRDAFTNGFSAMADEFPSHIAIEY